MKKPSFFRNLCVLMLLATLPRESDNVTVAEHNSLDCTVWGCLWATLTRDPDTVTVAWHCSQHRFGHNFFVLAPFLLWKGPLDS